MPVDYQLRQVGHENLSDLLDLYQHLHPDDAKPNREAAERAFERFMAYEGSAIFVAEVNGNLVASCTLVVVPNLTRCASPYGLIENVVTHRDFRNCGLGNQVLAAASAAAWDAGCYKVMLMTGSAKPKTLNFYLRAGFEQSKTGFQKRRPTT